MSPKFDTKSNCSDPAVLETARRRILHSSPDELSVSLDDLKDSGIHVSRLSDGIISLKCPQLSGGAYEIVGVKGNQKVDNLTKEDTKFSSTPIESASRQLQDRYSPPHQFLLSHGAVFDSTAGQFILPEGTTMSGERVSESNQILNSFVARYERLKDLKLQIAEGLDSFGNKESILRFAVGYYNEETAGIETDVYTLTVPDSSGKPIRENPSANRRSSIPTSLTKWGE